MANPLSGLLGPDRERALNLLSYVVARSEEFSNSVHYLVSGKGVELFIMDHDDRRGPHPDLLVTRGFFQNLISAGIVDQKTMSHNTFVFSQAAIASYRNEVNKSDGRVRSLIGRYLHNIYQDNGEDFIVAVIPDLAREIGVTENRVSFQMRMLLNVGLLNDDAPINSDGSVFYVSFTQSGHRWSMQGFPEDEIGTGNIMNVQVNVQVLNVLPLIEQIERSDVDRSSKEELEALARDLQKGPTAEKASRLLWMAAHIQQLFPAVARFISDNAHLISQVPH